MRYDATIAPLPRPAIAELRGDPAAAAAWLASIGCAGPTAANRCAHGAADRAVLWLGPRRWLVFAPASGEGALETAVARAPQELVAAMVSDMLTGLAIVGPAARDVLSQGTPLDLDALPEDGATMTEMFGVAALLRAAEPPGAEIWIDRSLGRYLKECFDAAAGM
jgi:heterotetrameric sarcosine oxidase gamma subunit